MPESQALLEDRMRRPVPGRAKRGHARLSVLHATRVEVAGWSVERDKLDAENLLTYRALFYSQAVRQAGRFLNGRPALIFAPSS